ncbi:MAG: ATP-binding protein [Methanomassiliicoccales archaeon]|nr:ATP-binding protein [Methanomassiliicoccales archaeon]
MSEMGRVFGNRVMELRFRTSEAEDLQVGEMLVVEEGAVMFLVRTMDVLFGADSDEDDWLEREAGKALREGTGEGYDYERVRDRLYKVGVCTPLGCLKDGEYRKAKSIPRHFSLVRRADQRDYDFLRPMMGDVEVGRLRSGDRVLDFRVGVESRSFPHHVGVFATTGMGKSNLMKSLALSCMSSRRCGFLILDPHGEYFDGGETGKKGLSHSSLAAEALDVYSSRRLSGPHSSIHISSSEIEIPDLANLYEFSGAQLECLQASQWRFGERWLEELRERGVTNLVEALGGKFHEGTVNVIKRRLDSIFQFELVTTDRDLSMTRAVISALQSGKTVLVDTSNMFEAEELLVSTVLARAVFEHNKALYSDKERFERSPPVLIALEEAQRVLSQSKGTVFSQIAREGRKFKVGLCALSQQPKLINEEVISQFNTLFILGLADKRDRDILRNSAKQDISMLDNEIQMLMPGEALIASPFTPFAVPCRVHLYEEYLSEMNAKAGQRTNKVKKDVDHRFF